MHFWQFVQSVGRMLEAHKEDKVETLRLTRILQGACDDLIKELEVESGN